jgi:16S rRNA (uracil1498-N3)-methyltransferase
VVGSLGRNPRHPRQVVEEYRSRHGKNPASVAIWIGPEGDFAPAELEMIQAGGAQPITLGPLVLRADTAAIYTLAVLGYETSWPGAPVPAGRGEHL